MCKNIATILLILLLTLLQYATYQRYKSCTGYTGINKYGNTISCQCNNSAVSTAGLAVALAPTKDFAYWHIINVKEYLTTNNSNSDSERLVCSKITYAIYKAALQVGVHLPPYQPPISSFSTFV